MLPISFIANGQELLPVPIRIDGVDGYFMVRPQFEVSTMATEMAPRYLDRIADLQIELAAADRQIAARDTLINRMTIEAELLRGLTAREREQRRNLETALGKVDRKWRRMRWWRPVAIGSTVAAVVLLLK